MTADVCVGALSCAFHRAQVIKPAPARRDYERRAKRTRRELGSWGLFGTVEDSRNPVLLIHPSVDQQGAKSRE